MAACRLDDCSGGGSNGHSAAIIRGPHARGVLAGTSRPAEAGISRSIMEVRKGGRQGGSASPLLLFQHFTDLPNHLLTGLAGV